jgi:hypothetical protein
MQSFPLIEKHAPIHYVKVKLYVLKLCGNEQLLKCISLGIVLFPKAVGILCHDVHEKKPAPVNASSLGGFVMTKI